MIIIPIMLAIVYASSRLDHYTALNASVYFTIAISVLCIVIGPVLSIVVNSLKNASLKS